MIGIHRLLRLVAVLTLAAVTGGCYFSGPRVIERGSDIGLADGKWECQGSSGTEEMIVEKRNEGTTAAPDIVYRVDKEDYRLEAIGGALFLAQSPFDTGNYAYALIAASDGGRQVRVLARKADAAAAVRALAAQHRVQVETFAPLNDADSFLVGAPADVRALLRALEPSLLMETASCRKVS